MIRRPLALALNVAALGSPAVAAAADSTYDADTGTSTPAGYGSAPGRPTGGSSPSGSACTWTVTGRLYVRDPTLDGIAGGDPLPGVAIKVSGADSFGSAFGTFGEWDTVYTDADGKFTVTPHRVRRPPRPRGGEVREQER